LGDNFQQMTCQLTYPVQLVGMYYIYCSGVFACRALYNILPNSSSQSKILIFGYRRLLLTVLKTATV